jgi:hypothetical protein
MSRNHGKWFMATCLARSPTNAGHRLTGFLNPDLCPSIAGAPPLHTPHTFFHAKPIAEKNSDAKFMTDAFVVVSRGLHIPLHHLL